jgi:hypothetical protein
MQLALDKSLLSSLEGFALMEAAQVDGRRGFIRTRARLSRSIRGDCGFNTGRLIELPKRLGLAAHFQRFSIVVERRWPILVFIGGGDGCVAVRVL